jgi:hypothetical protein
MGNAPRTSASLDPDDADSPHYHEEALDTLPNGTANGASQTPAAHAFEPGL